MHKLRILVVDDESQMHRFLGPALNAAGYDPVDYLQRHHDKIVTLHIKDRKRPADGANLPFGEGETPIKPVLLLDAYSRMHYKSIFSLNPGRSRALFLPAISVEGLQRSDLPQLRDRVFQSMETALREENAAWIGAVRG